MSKTENTASETLLAIIIAIPLGILITCYGVFVILKIVNWYNVPIVLSFSQWFGVDLILSVLTIGFIKSEDKGDQNKITAMFGRLISKVIVLTAMLGIYYMAKFFV